MKTILLALGSVLAFYGLTRRSLGGALMALLGSGICYRVLGGNYGRQVFGTQTASGDLPQSDAINIRVARSVTVQRSRQELYRFWRDLENLPRFMEHLASVQVLDARRSHWVARVPLEWDTEISEEIANERIAWKSPGEGEVSYFGSVQFEHAPSGHGTRVTLVLNYNLPRGAQGKALAQRFGDAPSRTLRADLQRFKELVENAPQRRWRLRSQVEESLYAARRV